jgi:hypothetical protein
MMLHAAVWQKRALLSVPLFLAQAGRVTLRNVHSKAKSSQRRSTMDNKATSSQRRLTM